MRYRDIITEVERNSAHKKMKPQLFMTDSYKKDLISNKSNDKAVYFATVNAMTEVAKYYGFKGNLTGRFKPSGNSGKSKNLTQIENNVYHYHIGPKYNEHRKDGDLVSNNIIEFQVIETNQINRATGNSKPALVIIFFSITTHGRGRWNINDIVDISVIDSTDDVEKVATRL